MKQPIYTFLFSLILPLASIFSMTYSALPGEDFSRAEPTTEEPGKAPENPKEGYPGYLEGQQEGSSQESSTNAGTAGEQPGETTMPEGSQGSSSTIVTLPQDDTTSQSSSQSTNENKSQGIQVTQELLSESEQESLNKKIDDILAATDTTTNQEELLSGFKRLSSQTREIYKIDPARAQDVLAIQAKYATVLSHANYQSLTQELSTFGKNFNEQASKATDLANQTAALANQLSDPTAEGQSEELFTKTLENIEDAYNSALNIANQLAAQTENLNTALTTLTARETILNASDIATFYTGFNQRVKNAVSQLVPPGDVAKLSGIISEAGGADFAEQLYNYSRTRPANAGPSSYDAIWSFLQDPIISTTFDMYSINKSAINSTLLVSTGSMERALERLTSYSTTSKYDFPQDMISSLKEAQRMGSQELEKAKRVKQILDEYKKVYPALQSEQLYALNKAVNMVFTLPGLESFEQLLKNALTPEQQETIATSKPFLTNARNSTDNLQALAFTKAMDSLHTTSNMLIKELPKTTPSAFQRFALWLKSFFSKSALNRLNTIRANREEAKNMKLEQFQSLGKQLEVQIDKLADITEKLQATRVSTRPLEEQIIYTVFSATQANPIDDIARLESAYIAASQAFQSSLPDPVENSLQAVKNELAVNVSSTAQTA